MGLKNETEEFERCVCGCGELTNVRKNTPVDKRLYYVDGVGQLKPSCYERVYSSEEGKRREELEAKLLLQEMGIMLD